MEAEVDDFLLVHRSLVLGTVIYRCLGAIGKVLGAFISFVRLRLFNLFSPAGALSKEFPSGMMALWTAIMLAGVVLVAYFSPV